MTTVVRLSDHPDVHVESWVSSGNLAIDAIIAGTSKGLPIGRIVEIFGDNATGKTLIMAEAMAQMQTLGGVTLLLEPEASVNMDFFVKLGVNPSMLDYAVTNTIKDTFEVMEKEIHRKNEEFGYEHPMLIGWDSVAATTTSQEMDKAIDEQDYGRGAGQISKAFRLGFARLCRESNVICIMINQIRQNIGVSFGNPVVTYGGKALPFYASVRLYLKTRGKIKDNNGHIIGVTVEVFVEKNKVAPPFKTAEFPLYFHMGSDEVAGIFWLCKNYGLFSQAGAWYGFSDANGNEVKFQGQGNFSDIFSEHEAEILRQLDIAMGYK